MHPTPTEPKNMYDLAHVCSSCCTVTIFAKDAAYPRRCGVCDVVVRESPSESRFVARPAFFDEGTDLVRDGLDDDDAFTLELGPASIEAAPF